MSLELILDPESPNYEQFQQALRQELAAVKGLRYSEVKAPAPPHVLDVEYDIAKFMFEGVAPHLLAHTLIEIVHAIAERLNLRSDEKSPLCMLVIDKASLPLPSSAQKERRLLQKTSRPKSPRNLQGRRAPKRKKPRKR